MEKIDTDCNDELEKFRLDLSRDANYELVPSGELNCTLVF